MSESERVELIIEGVRRELELLRGNRRVWPVTYMAMIIGRLAKELRRQAKIIDGKTP